VPSRQPWLLYLFLVALLLRLGLVATRDNSLAWPDERDYDSIARNLSRTCRFEEADGRRAARSPGYPLFLAALYSIGLDRPRHVFFIQAILGACTCVLVALLGSRLSGRSSGLVAGFLAAGCPYLIYFSGLLLTETIFTIGIVTFFLALEWLRERALGERAGGLLLAAAIGILAGMLVHVRSSFLLFPLWIAPFLLLRFRPRARTWTLWGTILLFAAITLAPWIWRNYVLFHHFVPTTLQSGESLYEANSPFADGGPAMDRIPWETVSGGRFAQRPDEDEAGRLRREYERDRFFRNEALRFIYQNPHRFASLALSKIGRFWNPVPNYEPLRTPRNLIASLLCFVPVVSLALVGLIALRRRPGLVAWVLCPVLYFTALHAVFVGSIRYRVPVMPFLMLLSGEGAVWLFQRRPQRAGADRWKRAACFVLASIVVGAACGFIAYLRLTDPERLRRMAQERLKAMVGSPVQISAARFEPFSGLILSGVRIRGDEDATDGTMLDVARALLTPDWRSLLSGRAAAWRSVEVEDVDLLVRFDETGKWRFLDRLRDVARKTAVPGAGPPNLRVTRARLDVVGLHTSMGEMPPIALRYVNADISPADHGRRYRGRVWSEDRDLGRPSATFMLNLETGRVTGTFAVVDLALGERLRSLLPEALRRKWDSFAPISGRFDVQGEFDWRKESPRSPEIACDLLLRDGRFNHPILPAEVSNISARAHLENSEFRVTSFRALVANALVSGSAHGRLSPDLSTATGGLALSAEGLPVSERWARMLPSRFQTLWERLAPGGSVNLACAIVRKAPDSRPEITASADLLDCTCRLPGWADAVSGIKGTLEYSSGRIHLRGISGNWGQGRIKIEDSVIPDDPSGPFSLCAEIRDIALRASLKEALPESLLNLVPHDLRRVVEVARLGGGEADVFLEARRLVENAGAEYRVEAEFRDLSLYHPLVEAPVLALRGKLLATERYIAMSPVIGLWAGGELEVAPFRWELASEGPRRLVAHVRNLALDESLYRNLNQAFRSTLEDYAATGKLDLEVAVEIPQERDRQVSLTTVARLREASLAYRGFPYPLSSVSGELYFESGHLERLEIRGQNGSARVRAALDREQVNGRSEAVITVQASEVGCDADLRHALPEPYAALWDRLHPRGGHLNATYEKRFPGEPWRPDLYRVALELGFENTTLDLGAPVEIASGRIVARSHPEPDDGIATDGTFSVGLLRVRGVELADLYGRFESDPRGVRIRDLAARCYGGSVSGNVELPTPPEGQSRPPPFRAILSLASADASDIARAYGIGGITGRLDANCTVNGALDENPTLVGAGTLTVQGEIGQLPGTLSVINLLRLQGLRAPAFHTLQLEYAIENSLTRVSTLNLLGDALSLYGQGVAREDGRIHLRFRPEFVGESRLPAVGQLIDTLKQTALPIRLEGEPGRVVWKLGWLTPIDRAVRALPAAMKFLGERIQGQGEGEERTRARESQ